MDDEALRARARAWVVERSEIPSCPIEDDVEALVRLLKLEHDVAIDKAARACHERVMRSQPVHGEAFVEAEECEIAIRRLLYDPETDRVAGLVRYFRHLSVMAIGSVLNDSGRELMGWVASWIENRVDVKWWQEIEEQRADR